MAVVQLPYVVILVSVLSPMQTAAKPYVPESPEQEIKHDYQTLAPAAFVPTDHQSKTPRHMAP
jgi:hypothetical protein